MWDGDDDDDDSDEECSLWVRAAGRRSYLVWRSSLPVQSQHGFVGTPPQTYIIFQQVVTWNLGAVVPGTQSVGARRAMDSEQRVYRRLSETMSD